MTAQTDFDFDRNNLNHQLVHACGKKRPDMADIRRLLAAGADVRAFSVSGSTALHAAACEGNVELGRLLLDAGADIDARMAEPARGGETPLSIAASWGHAAFVIMLLEEGADPDIADTRAGHTPLMWVAMDEDMTQALHALLAAGANVRAKKNDGMTALDCASEVDARSGNAENVRILKDKFLGRYVSPFQKAATRRASETISRGIPEPLKTAPRIRIRKYGGMRRG